jgi:tetratricopeptide (TPR) repeat protein
MKFLTRSNERKWNLRHDGAMRLAIFLFVLCIGAQMAFWSHTRKIMPEMGIVADVPGERTVRALSFGDEEAFFRLLALNIQSSGDTFGRFTALYKYDYNKLYHWFHLLDSLNNRSNYLPAMATYYFSQTQNPKDVRYIVDYLDEYTDGRVKEKWWWVVQGVYLAMHKMEDNNRAIQLADRLRGVRGIPIWAQQMPAFVEENRGEFGDALTIIQDILKHPEDFSQGELNFMRYFIDERLGKLDSVKKELDAIDAQKKAEAAKAKAEGRTIVDPYVGPPSDVGAPQAPPGVGATVGQ